MGICASDAADKPQEQPGNAPQKAETVEKKPVEEKKPQQNPPTNQPDAGTSKPAAAEADEADNEAFEYLKTSIIKGWAHIIDLIKPRDGKDNFQKLAQSLQGKKTYFDITPHKPMEAFFRKCLDFKNPEFVVGGVDLDNSNSIDFERKKFEIFLSHVEKTEFKKSVSLEILTTELSKAVKETVTDLQKTEASVEAMMKDGADKGELGKVLVDLQIIIQIFKILDEDDEAEEETKAETKSPEN
mmetsp:Transcript_6061/g.9200  ORF Transcript_6061/g.9200 Transcript_6061/m.9200 type:complete len:242 (+) Transcript_6061:103-828(+)|eukprot:CAMPEP_0167759522 /NCGR_PEP_ID=MMETSP0110_2-20121227/11073_1 /TAXON_ID=629695 /ORGANISM="Gymnochlora sp., Strain CCMP2014" /LENGTH=241 /DNA_ID=CAMNT_0007645923 /DNA_START=741 /DNA_END=1466 /DNA_ORIENTATION=-